MVNENLRSMTEGSSAPVQASAPVDYTKVSSKLIDDINNQRSYSGLPPLVQPVPPKPTITTPESGGGFWSGVGEIGKNIIGGIQRTGQAGLELNKSAFGPVGGTIVSSIPGAALVSGISQKISDAQERMKSRATIPVASLSPQDQMLEKIKNDAMSQPLTPSEKSGFGAPLREQLRQSSNPVVSMLTKIALGQNEEGFRGLANTQGFWETAAAQGIVGLMAGTLIDDATHPQNQAGKEWEYTKALMDNGYKPVDANKYAKEYIGLGATGGTNISDKNAQIVLNGASAGRFVMNALGALDGAGIAGNIIKPLKAAIEASDPVRIGLIKAAQAGDANEARKLITSVVPKLKDTKQLDDLVMGLTQFKNPVEMQRALEHTVGQQMETAARTAAQTGAATAPTTLEVAKSARAEIANIIKGNQELNRLNHEVLQDEIKAGTLPFGTKGDSLVKVYKTAETGKGIKLGDTLSLAPVDGVKPILEKASNLVRLKDGSFTFAPSESVGKGIKLGEEVIHAPIRNAVAAPERAAAKLEAKVAKTTAQREANLAAKTASKELRATREAEMASKAEQMAKEKALATAIKEHAMARAAKVAEHPKVVEAVKTETKAKRGVEATKAGIKRAAVATKEKTTLMKGEIAAQKRYKIAQAIIKKTESQINAERRAINARKTLTAGEKVSALHAIDEKYASKLDSLKASLQRHKEVVLADEKMRSVRIAEAKKTEDVLKKELSSRAKLHLRAKEATKGVIESAKQEIANNIESTKTTLKGLKTPTEAKVARQATEATRPVEEGKVIKSVENATNIAEKKVAQVAKASEEVKTAKETKINASQYFERTKAILGREGMSIDRNSIIYQEATDEERLRSAAELIAEDREKAIRIATGEETSTKYSANALAVTLDAVLKSEGKIDELADIAAKVSLRSTKMGQEIQILHVLGEQSPIRAMLTVMEARKARLLREGIDVSKEASSFIEKGKSVLEKSELIKSDIISVVDKITC